MSINIYETSLVKPPSYMYKYLKCYKCFYFDNPNSCEHKMVPEIARSQTMQWAIGPMVRDDYRQHNL